MTVNKSQGGLLWKYFHELLLIYCFSGQTLKYVGVWNRSPLFTHGQLYVAVSRVGSPDNIKFAVMNGSDNKPKPVENIVFREVLLPN